MHVVIYDVIVKQTPLPTITVKIRNSALKDSEDWLPEEEIITTDNWNIHGYVVCKVEFKNNEVQFLGLGRNTKDRKAHRQQQMLALGYRPRREDPGPSLGNNNVNKVMRNAKLVEDSRLMEKWTNPEYEILFKVYVHSIKNPDEIMNGAIPEVTESGPYTFTKKVTNK
ncbi:hypothetical protein TELCIR_13122, partial [Teladorsagia circumcincta]